MRTALIVALLSVSLLAQSAPDLKTVQATALRCQAQLLGVQADLTDGTLVRKADVVKALDAQGYVVDASWNVTAK